MLLLPVAVTAAIAVATFVPFSPRAARGHARVWAAARSDTAATTHLTRHRSPQRRGYHRRRRPRRGADFQRAQGERQHVTGRPTPSIPTTTTTTPPTVSAPRPPSNTTTPPPGKSSPPDLRHTSRPAIPED